MRYPTTAPDRQPSTPVPTQFLRLFHEVSLGERIDGWRVCWVGGWDRCRVVFVVMVEDDLGKANPSPNGSTRRRVGLGDR
jgi:hypothetical protein